MDSPAPHLCTACGKNPATRHITSVNGGEVEKLELCDVCAEASPPSLWKDFLEALKNGRCRFCGGQAAATDMSHILGGAGAEMGFLCRSCSTEYHQRIGDAFASFDSTGEGEPPAETKRIRTVFKEVDNHMQQWVRQRDN